LQRERNGWEEREAIKNKFPGGEALIGKGEAMFRTKHGRELAVYHHLTRQGYDVIKRGHPDLIAINWEKREVRFIEVKAKGDRLKPQQIKAQKAYELAGLEYEVIRVGQDDGDFTIIEP